MNRQETGVYSVYKNRGETPLECLNRVRQENRIADSTPMTYAGRLDPMAEGALIILVGDMVKRKDEFLDLPKTYVFTVLWGVSTDTYDILGKISSISKTEVPSVSDIGAHIKKNIGVFDQVYPPYSSKPVMGKPLFQWAREGRLDEIDIPSHPVEILSANHVERRYLSTINISEYILEGISSVHGDFRQKEIIDFWNDYFSGSTQDYVLDTIEVTVSSGFYIRQFVQDLGCAFGTQATTYQIIRSAIGTYKVEK